MQLCEVLDLFRTFRPHPKTLIGEIGMDKKAAFDKIRLIYEISKISNQQLILENTELSDRNKLTVILAEMRVFSSALMDYTRAALSKKMTWISRLKCMLKCLYKLYFSWQVNGSRSVSPVAAYQVASTVQAVCTIVSRAQEQNLLSCTLHMGAIGEQTLEAAFRIGRLQGGGGTELTLLSHRLKLEKQMLFTELISGFPALRERLFRNHDVETLNPCTLKGTDLTLECFRNIDLAE